MFLPRRGEGVLLCNLSAIFGTNRSLNRSPRPRWLCHRPQRPLLSSGQNHYFCFHPENMFFSSQYQKNFTSVSFQTIFSSWFFAAFYLQCKLQLLAQTSWPSRDGNLSALHIFIEVIWGWKSGYGNLPPMKIINMEMKIRNKKIAKNRN